MFSPRVPRSRATVDSFRLNARYGFLIFYIVYFVFYIIYIIYYRYEEFRCTLYRRLVIKADAPTLLPSTAGSIVEASVVILETTEETGQSVYNRESRRNFYQTRKFLIYFVFSITTLFLFRSTPSDAAVLKIFY